MSQHFYTSDELDHILAEIKEHQHRDMLLRIDEVLAVLDMASPAGEHWKTARRRTQLIEGNKFAALAGVLIGAG